MSGKTTMSPGLTLIEVTIALASSSVLLFAIGAVIVDSHNQWHKTYIGANEGIHAQGRTAVAFFESTVRKSTRQRCDIAHDGSMLTIYYYREPLSSVQLDAYAEFYLADGDLMVDTGRIIAATWQKTGSVTTNILASNVAMCRFAQHENVISMTLELNDGNRELNISSSAARRNR